MKTIKEAYPLINADGNWWYGNVDGPENYRDLIDTFEYEVIAEGHDDDYQGDSFYLFKNEGKFGFLVFGWGSCSGCDAFQAADTLKDLEVLQQKLYSDIVWSDSKESLINYLTEPEKIRMRHYVYELGNGFADFKKSITKALGVEL